MRCRNCGWENDLGALKCDKCNAPLNGSMVDNHQHSHREDVSSEQILNKTIRECDTLHDTNDNLKKCSNCGYLYSPEMGNCPNCGNSESHHSSQKSQNSNGNQASEALIKCPVCHEMVPSKFNFCANCGKPFKMGTVNPWAKPQNGASCTLTPIAWEEENIVPDTIKYSGNSIVLNRDNTDPNNNSITSKEQAVLSYEEGVWYIEDKSQMQTTYLHVSKKTKLEDGAIIILGNRRFIFKK